MGFLAEKSLQGHRTPRPRPVCRSRSGPLRIRSRWSRTAKRRVEPPAPPKNDDTPGRSRAVRITSGRGGSLVPATRYVRSCNRQRQGASGGRRRDEWPHGRVGPSSSPATAGDAPRGSGSPCGRFPAAARPTCPPACFGKPASESDETTSAMRIALPPRGRPGGSSAAGARPAGPPGPRRAGGALGRARGAARLQDLAQHAGRRHAIESAGEDRRDPRHGPCGQGPRSPRGPSSDIGVRAQKRKPSAAVTSKPPCSRNPGCPATPCRVAPRASASASMSTRCTSRWVAQQGTAGPGRLALPAPRTQRARAPRHFPAGRALP
jgi:hypothetical protein